MCRKDARARSDASESSRDLPAHWGTTAAGSTSTWAAWVRKNTSRECYRWSALDLPVCIIGSTDVLLQELGVPFISISAPSIVSGMSGESEKTLRDTFDEAKVCTE